SLNRWVFQDSLDLRGEHQRFVAKIPVKRLDAVAIPRQEQSLVRLVPDGKGEHAVETPHAVVAPFLVRVDDDFGIGPRMELMAARFEFDAQSLEIVNLTIENNDDVPSLVGHGLVPVRRQEKNSQWPVPRTDGAVRIVSFTTRPAVGDDIRHPFEQIGRDLLAASIAYPRDSTHPLLPCRNPSPPNSVTPRHEPRRPSTIPSGRPQLGM